MSGLTDEGELLGYPCYRQCIGNCCTLFGVDERIASLDSAVAFCTDCEDTIVNRIAAGTECDSTVAESLFLSFMLKKWRFASAQTMRTLSEEAVSGFLARNDRAKTLALPPVQTLDRMRRILARWLPPVGIRDGKFGPGAVAERWSHARRWEVLDPYFADAVYYRRDAILGDSLAASPHDRLFDHDHARLCAVPKQWNKQRLITVEPAFRSFLQQGARETIYTSIAAGPLRGSAFDLRVDGALVQRQLALKGSHDGQLATIDLSDASDNITWDLVQSVFPSWVVCVLEQCRTPFCYTPDGSSFPLHIYAGMGNATTFVVESLLFGAYVAAISWRYGAKASRPSVFGDDIICESRLFPYLLEQDDDFFRINTRKSFARLGPGLRESCGIFAYKGQDVTPLRINGFRKGPLGVQGLAMCIQSNLESHLPYRVRFAAELGRVALEKGTVVNLPFKVDGGDKYISIPWLPYGHVPTRQNAHLQRREALVEVTETRTVRVPSDRPCYLAGALLGVIETSPSSRRGSSVVFPVKGRPGPTRKRWRVCHC